jgi:multidrug efflux pump subunit AcrB
VNIRYSGGLGSVTRVDQKRVITISGNNEGKLPSEILDESAKRLADVSLAPGYAISYTGENEDMTESQQFLSKAFVVALFLIAAVIVAEFDSVATTVIIMASVIFSLIGVFAGLLITNMPFGVIMTGIGVISLAGIVVKNAIVLLDYVGKLRERGLACTEALVRGGITRMRPVLLTAMTTILGLVPMATGISYDFVNQRLMLKTESSQMWSQMAVAVIFGLTVATLLTLVVVPVMYSMLDSAKGAIGRPWKPRDAEQ